MSIGENLIGVVTPFMTSLGARNYKWLPYVITR